MSPTPRAALLLAAVALSALIVPPVLAGLAMLAVASAVVVDSFSVRTAPSIGRDLPHVVSRGIPAPVQIRASGLTQRPVVIRQATPPDIDVAVPVGESAIETELVAHRRGVHVLPPVALRAEGPLGLGRWHHRAGGDREVLVYPDLVSARKLALAVREGRFRESGRMARGPLGLGTDFESVRDYNPDDDIRQVNWRATVRMGRPMSNQYRIEQDREVMCVVDCGRLMAAPLGDRTRLDAAIDAVTAVALVADQLGDHSGLIAFDSKITRRMSPRRRGSAEIVAELFDLEPSDQDSDYELAFRTIEGAKRSFILVLTDLLDQSAASALVDATPVLSKRHHVVIASTTDTDLAALIATEPTTTHEVHSMSVALDVLEARARVATKLKHAGAEVIEAPPQALGAACVAAYMRAKARARL